MYDGQNAHSRSTLTEPSVFVGGRSVHGFVEYGCEPAIDGRWNRTASLTFIAASSTTLWTLIGLAFIRIM